MHYNPVRRGYVDDPLHWRYSSARDYAGARRLIAIETDWQRERDRSAPPTSLCAAGRSAGKRKG
jgi:hypothetical protein